jgi:hypothetical protein
MKLQSLPKVIIEVINTKPELLEWKHLQVINQAISVDYDLDKLTINEVKLINEICDMLLGEGM